MNRQLFQGVGSGSQLSFLALFFFVGLMLTGVVSAVYLAISGKPNLDLLSPNMLKAMQTLQAVIVFLAPALLCAYLFHESPKQYLTLRRPFSAIQFLIVCGIMVSILPFINWIGYYNSHMVLPEALAGLESQLKGAEKEAEKLIQLLLSDKGLAGFLSSLFVIGLVAAVCEEFLFRGVLQQTLIRFTRNIHLAVWISAIVFSAIHFQFYGFVPRMILGAVLGYIFIWTGSIWASVLAHFLNNAFFVVFYYLYVGTPIYGEFDKFGTKDGWPYALAGFLVASLLLALLHRTKSVRKEEMNTESVNIQR
jgi:membrane protease YdiL (CAAX protease family)